MLVVAAPPLPRMGPAGEGAEPPPRRDWLDLYGRLVGTPPPPRPVFVVPPRTPDGDGDAEEADASPSSAAHELSPLQQRLPDEVLLHVLSRLGGADAPYALARVALVCRHFRLLASAPCLWERAAWRAFTAPAFLAGLGRRAAAEAQAQAEAEEEWRRRQQQQQQQEQQQTSSVHAVAHAVWAAPNPTPAAPQQHQPHARPRAAVLPPAPPAAAAFAAGPAAVQRLLATRHRGSWRHLYLSTPRPRTDGIYVSRNTYVRVGARELRSASGSKTCHLVAYFRYWLFLPTTGALVYRTSPLPPARVARGMAQLAAAVERAAGLGGGGGWAAAAAAGDWGDDDDGAGALPAAANNTNSNNKQPSQPQSQQQQQQHALVGRHAVRGTDVLCAVAYPNARRTEIRTRLSLRSSGCPGSWNRVDVKSIESFDREDGTRSALDGAGGAGQSRNEDEEEDDDDALWQAALGVEAARGLSSEARRAHRRGLNPGVFVPWGEVLTTRLNDPPSKMDVFIPG